MELYDVVVKLVGPIQAVGETQADALRLENLKELTELIDRLLSDINQASYAALNHQDSMKKIGKCAAEYLGSLKD